MKKTITALCLIFSSFLLLPSCKKDSPAADTDPIVGKWTLTEDGRDINDNGNLDAGEVSAISGHENIFDFNANGTYEEVYKSAGVTDYIKKGTYNYKDNILVITESCITETANVLSLTKDNLTLKFQDTPAYFGIYTR